MGVAVAQRLDRKAGGDAAVQRELHRFRAAAGAHARQRAGEVAANDPWREMSSVLVLTRRLP